MLNQLEELDLCEENIIEINILQKLKDNNQTYIELLLQKRCYIEEMRNEYQKSSSYEKREKIHDKYLNALETVKNTGGEDINAIQDQLQKNKKRCNDLVTLQKEQDNIEMKIDKSIDCLLYTSDAADE